MISLCITGKVKTGQYLASASSDAHTCPSRLRAWAGSPARATAPSASGHGTTFNCMVRLLEEP